MNSKLIAIACAACLVVFALAGCSGSSSQSTSDNSKASTEQASSKATSSDSSQASDSNSSTKGDSSKNDSSAEASSSSSSSSKSRAYGEKTDSDDFTILDGTTITVTAKDGFDNRGFTTFVCQESGTYTFKSDTKKITWKAYVMDEQFDDAVRYIPQAADSTIEANSDIDLADGQYVYVECSSNAYTDDKAKDGTLSISME